MCQARTQKHGGVHLASLSSEQWPLKQVEALGLPTCEGQYGPQGVNALGALHPEVRQLHRDLGFRGLCRVRLGFSQPKGTWELETGKLGSISTMALCLLKFGASRKTSKQKVAT